MKARILRFVAIAAVITLVLPFALIASQWPRGMNGGALDFSGIKDKATEAAPPAESYTARDGTKLPYRWFDAGAGTPVLVLVHGSSWHSLQFEKLGRVLSGMGVSVAAPDLRGHGFDPGLRGDVDHIGQLEEDIADLIAVLKERAPGAKIFIGGHSSGAGMAVRFAGGENGGLAQGYVLMAPVLQYDAPTTRPNAGGWAHVLVRRSVGLTVLMRR
jgi:alpha-beta hydrolase superfamily lysophospholipase